MGKWVYELSPQEEALAARVGWERQLPMLGQPERNRNYSEGDIWESWQHMIAAASEIAAARMLGMTDYEPEANTFKSKLDIPGYEVRYSFTKNAPGQPKYALRFKDGVDDYNQIYILIVGGPEVKVRRSSENGYKAPAFRAVGWAYGKNCIKVEYLAPYGKGNYSVPITGLNEMSTLPIVEPISA